MTPGPAPVAPGWLPTALALAAAAAVSLGLARFAYALLLPAMRAELGWSYFTAGSMNTLNAAGYLAGALAAPWVLRRWDARRAMLGGGFAAALLLALHGLVPGQPGLWLLRALCGVASAASFVGGGVLAARLAAAVPQRAGLVLGIYYGGTGLGIVASAWLLPLLPWRAGWGLLGALALAATLATARGTGALTAPPVAGAPRAPLPLREFAFGLAGYLLFGLGYIGYMTFNITLLREAGLAAGWITAFFTLLGLGVMASSRLWAPLLQRHRGGLPMALLNGLLALATVLPVFSTRPLAVLLSGALFGSVFLSVVASTTALVRHNAEAAAWPAGIAAFTTVFAAGQIVGPGLVGWVADSGLLAGEGGLAAGSGLRGGLLVSAGLLALGALLALGQKPRAQPGAAGTR